MPFDPTRGRAIPAGAAGVQEPARPGHGQVLLEDQPAGRLPVTGCRQGFFSVIYLNAWFSITRSARIRTSLACSASSSLMRLCSAAARPRYRLIQLELAGWLLPCLRHTSIQDSVGFLQDRHDLAVGDSALLHQFTSRSPTRRLSFQPVPRYGKLAVCVGTWTGSN